MYREWPPAHSRQNTNTKIILVCHKYLSSSLSLGYLATLQCFEPYRGVRSTVNARTTAADTRAYPVWQGLLLSPSSSLTPGSAALLHEGWAGGVCWRVCPACLPVRCQRRGLRRWLCAHRACLHTSAPGLEEHLQRPLLRSILRRAISMRDIEPTCRARPGHQHRPY